MTAAKAKSTSKTAAQSTGKAQQSVLIIGNSHAGALRSAAEEFSARYPEVTLTFFASPGTSFTRAQPDEDNNFVPKTFSDEEVATVVAINGVDRISLNGFDHILAIGHRPDLFELGGLAGEDGGFGLLDEDIAAPHLLSRELIEDWVDHILDPWVARMARIFGAQKTSASPTRPIARPRLSTKGTAALRRSNLAVFRRSLFWRT